MKSFPALTAGADVFTVAVTDAVAVHPFDVLVFVTVYVVVEVGFAVGLLTVDELNPVAGDQE